MSEFKGKINSCIIMVGNFNFPFLRMNGTTSQKIRKWRA